MKQTKSKDTNLEAKLWVQLLVAGTSACIADVVTFPLDTAKVRLQVQGEVPLKAALNIANGNTVHLVQPNQFRYRGMVGTILTMTKQEGFKSLYNGLSAGLQRQMCFASVRLGLYDSVKQIYKNILKEREDSLQIATRVLAGLTTGGMAVVVAQPTDVVKVRFQATSKVKTSASKYTSTFQAYKLIGREEGIKGLWKGALPNIGRNSIVNVSEIVCYDIIKDILLQNTRLEDNIKCHFSAGLISGFITTVVASPIDVVKTRYMNSPQSQYRGAIHCAMKMGANEGLTAFYKGFVPSFYRLVSWNIVMWITYEQMKLLFYKPKIII